MLLALLLAIGLHAADAELHARDPEAAWVRAPMVEMYNSTTSVPAVTRRVYGYLPYWQSIDLTTFRWDLITDIIPFSVGIGTDGTISNPHALPGAALVSAAHAHGVKVHLGATLFNSSGGSEIATFLASSAAKTKAVQQLTALAAGIEGVDLDFEVVPSASKALFTGFVKQLHEAIPALEVSLAVPGLTSYTGYDSAALAPVSTILLMEYDYHWRTAPTTGANAPIPSVEKQVDNFIALAPAGSIALGVPYYGYEWPCSGTSPGASTTGGGSTVLFSAVFGKFATYGRLWDTASLTPWYSYASHQGWVDDDQSLALRYQFVNQRNLRGIMIWALGYDGARTEAWDALKTAFGKPPDPPPVAPGVLQIVSANFALDGTVARASLHVKNVGGQSIQPVDPAPSTVFTEEQTAASVAQGSWRVAVDVADRPMTQLERPWRWGLAQPLAPGAETDLSLGVQLEKTGTRTLWAAVIHEGVDRPQDYLGQTDLTVPVESTPDAGQSDAGEPDAGATNPGPPEARVGGCAHAGAGPFVLLVLLAWIASGKFRLRNSTQRV